MNRVRTIIGTLAVLAGLGAIAGLATLAAGLFDTSARNGHWAVTDWVLHTTFEQRVARLAPPESAVPGDLDDPALIELGARHYDSACAMCHATPGGTAGATIAAMEPQPPQIKAAVAPWSAAELHWIVDEGVKMTGMPAWPAGGRQDEVWAVVAFLRAVDRGMGAEDYARITAPDPAGGCAGCHGPAGSSRAPRLDILTPEYIAAAIRAYRSGARPSGMMAHAAATLAPEEIDALSRALARLSPPEPEDSPVPEAATTADAAAGARLAARGTVEIPACLSCHGAAGAGPMMPSLDGQGAAYLSQQLRLWRDGARGGAERAPLMTAAARSLTDDEIDALSRYFAGR